MSEPGRTRKRSVTTRATHSSVADGARASRDRRRERSVTTRSPRAYVEDGV